MLAVAVPVGLLIGLSLGALGGGGSILTVPALVYLLSQSPRQATTGSLIIVGITALTGMAAHLRAGRVRLRQGAVFGVLGVAGAYAGSRLSAHADPNALLAGFSALMLVAAAAMVRWARRPAASVAAPTKVTVRARSADGASHRGATAADEPPEPATAREEPASGTDAGTGRAIRVVAAASVVGLLTGFFGVGGGFVIVPALVLALGFPMPVAVGTSLLVIAINSAVALLTRLGGGVHLDWGLLAAFTAAAIAGSFAGSRIASRVDPRRLTLAFVVLLVAVAAYTAARSVPHVF